MRRAASCCVVLRRAASCAASCAASRCVVAMRRALRRAASCCVVLRRALRHIHKTRASTPPIQRALNQGPSPTHPGEKREKVVVFWIILYFPYSLPNISSAVDGL